MGGERDIKSGFDAGYEFYFFGFPFAFIFIFTGLLFLAS